MNDRFRELAAKIEFTSDVTYAELQKFTELIIQDCIDVTNAEMDDILDQSVFNPTDEIWNRARVEELVRVVRLINKHFGIKEC